MFLRRHIDRMLKLHYMHKTDPKSYETRLKSASTQLSRMKSAYYKVDQRVFEIYKISTKKLHFCDIVKCDDDMIASLHRLGGEIHLVAVT